MGGSLFELFFQIPFPRSGGGTPGGAYFTEPNFEVNLLTIIGEIYEFIGRRGLNPSIYGMLLKGFLISHLTLFYAGEYFSKFLKFWQNRALFEQFFSTSPSFWGVDPEGGVKGDPGVIEGGAPLA